VTDPNGDERDWLRQVMRRYEGPLVAFAAHVTGSRELARDVVQDTFLRLCEADRAQLEGHLAGWLFRVCRNRALDVVKKEGRMSYPGSAQVEAAASGGASPAAQVEARRELSEVLRVLASLPASQQEVVRLKLQANLSYAEISEVTGHSVSNVGVLLHTALKTIRQRMGNGRVP
jgi:RNA polymerase sigma factor (sigma-70 family)